MPLDNTAKLADIIAALQTMEGINAKAELASVVGSPANADDTMATINRVIQGAKNTLAAKMDDGSSGAEPLEALIEKLFVGKKWASGTVASSNATFLEITGLTFKPSTIIIAPAVDETNGLYFTLYNSTMSTKYSYGGGASSPTELIANGYFVRTGSFKLRRFGTLAPTFWIAFE